MFNDYKITLGSTIKSAFKKLKKNGYKCLIVVNKNDNFLGTLSDGDLRNAILELNSINSKINKFVNKKPIFYFENNFSFEKVKKNLQEKNLPFVPIISRKKKVIKIINLKFFFQKKYIKKISLPVVIMAGGRGKRLLPYTKILPKPLIPYNGIPLIEHIIKKFNSYGIRQFYISINYKSSLMKAFFSNFKNDSKIKYLKESKPLGTAGSLKFLSKIKDKNLLVVNCDTLIDFNLQDLISFHTKNNCDITILASVNNIKIPYGVIDITDDAILKKMNEKPTFKYLANTGCYLINKRVIKLIPKNKLFDFSELINKSKKINYKIKVFSIREEDWKDAGTLDELS